MTKRLIEAWLPIAEIGIESLRERTPMTPYPAPNRLHICWARRPLVASRAAILASLLPATANRQTFKEVLGIHGNPILAQQKIEKARRTGIRVVDPYGYQRAYNHLPTAEQLSWISAELKQVGIQQATVLDPTAGGGSIPLEAVRLSLQTFGNDLNPVAVLCQRATVDWPLKFGNSLLVEYERIAANWRNRIDAKIGHLFPRDDVSRCVDETYLWARTVRCPHCEGVVPLSPNWKLDPDGRGLALVQEVFSGLGDTRRKMAFRLVESLKEQSVGTVSGGDAVCPFTDCGRLISGDEVKAQAQAKRMGEQMFAIVFSRLEDGGMSKAGKPKKKWTRAYRAVSMSDDADEIVHRTLEDKLPEWEANNFVPTEPIGEISNYDRGHRMYGMEKWTDLFSKRQLIVHATCVESFHEVFAE